MTEAPQSAADSAAGDSLGRVSFLLTIESPGGGVRQVPCSAAIDPATVSFEDPHGRDSLDQRP